LISRSFEISRKGSHHQKTISCIVLRAVSVGELFLSKDKCVFLVEFWISFVLEEEGLDSVLEEVLVAKGAVVDDRC